MKYAFINEGVLQDVVMTHPSILFSEGYAKQFVEVPDDCINGWTFDGTTFSPPEGPTQEQKANFWRSVRNEKLSKSDWTQVSDSPTDKTVWAAYRQSLRDVTKQPGFPSEVEWPIEPT